MRISTLYTNRLYLLFLALSGCFTLYEAATFFLGSEDTLHRMIAEHGLLRLFLKRFLGFAVFGGLIALGMTFPKILFTVFHRQKNWLEARQLVKQAILLHLLCALLGSAIFTVSVRNSRADGITTVEPF